MSSEAGAIGEANTTHPIVVAVDGPAGSGKSSVSRAAARELGFAYQDTGAAYRAFAWHCLETGVDRLSEHAITDAVRGFQYAIGTDPDRYFVRVGGEDVTTEIRESRVSAAVSSVARVPAVRERLIAIFRAIIASTDRPGIITEGRDITTVVSPDAPVRILLTASAEVRAARRAAELSGEDVLKTADDLTSRDVADSKVVDFMNAAEGVTLLDTTNLDFDKSVQAVVDLIKVASPAG